MAYKQQRLAKVENVEVVDQFSLLDFLIVRGATDFPSFTTHLKQLVTPLSTQLSDRRSSIVKQACRLLCLLSKELLGDFEACAEMFIPEDAQKNILIIQEK